MKTPGIFDGIVTAAMISLVVAVFALFLGGYLLFGSLFYLLLSGASLAYLVYLMKRSGARIGKLVVFSAWFVTSLGGWILDAALIEQVLLQAGLIWLVRSLYFHNSLFSAALDFGLVSLGLAAATWAFINTGSLAISLWAFFLLQSFFCWLPDLATPSSKSENHTQAAHSGFQAAHRVASEAVRKLAQP